MRRTFVQTLMVFLCFVFSTQCDRPGMVRKPFSFCWLRQAWRDAKVLGA
jgi:hypothetical protein